MLQWHNDKNGKKATKKQKENPVECAREGKQSKGNIGEGKRTVDSAKFEFCHEITRRRCDGKGGKGREGNQEWKCTHLLYDRPDHSTKPE